MPGPRRPRRPIRPSHAARLRAAAAATLLLAGSGGSPVPEGAGEVVVSRPEPTPVDEILTPLAKRFGFSLTVRCGARCARTSGTVRGPLDEVLPWLLRAQNHLVVRRERGGRPVIDRVVLMPGAAGAALFHGPTERRRTPARASPRLHGGPASPPPLAGRPPPRGPAAPAGTFRLTSGFGWRPDPFSGDWSHHPGLDLAAPRGTPVEAPWPGRVVASGWSGDYGLAVEIDHGNGVVSRYGHLARTLAAAGQPVRAGQRIGLVGSTGRSTGPHLHFEVRVRGRPVDPLQPRAPTATRTGF